MKKSINELIFTFENCRFWLRFPGLSGDELNDCILQLSTDRAANKKAITKPFLKEGSVQAEQIVVDVYKTSGGYEFKLGSVSIKEANVFF